MKPNKRILILGAGILVLIATYVFNKNFHATLDRNRAIRESKNELKALDAEIEKARQEVALLEKQPAAIEKKVRSDLGYLRPGEKEVRFINSEEK